MSSAKPSQPHPISSINPEDWEVTLETLSRQLCSKRELSIHLKRQEMYARNGATRIKMFPIWRRYRRKAERVARIQGTVPFLKNLPLSVSAFISDILDY